MKKIITFLFILIATIGINAQEFGLAPKVIKPKDETKQQFNKKNDISVNTYSTGKSILNYDFEEATGTFASISATGTALTPNGWDDGEIVLDLTGTYTFTYNLNHFNTFNISTNGAIDLGGTGDISFTNDLADPTKTPMIAPLWDDLRFYGNGVGEGIFYQIDNVSGENVLTIEWYNVARYSYEGMTVSFQIKLYENSGIIELIYGDMTQASGWTASATIGINDLEGSDAVFASITPGTPATVSNSTSNNTIAGTIISGITSGTIYRFVPIFLTNDLMAYALEPLTVTPGTDVYPIVSVLNSGTTVQSTFNVNLLISPLGSATPVYNYVENVSDNVNPGEIYQHTFSNVWAAVPEGVYTATFIVELSGDDNTSNNTLEKTIVVANTVNMSNGTDTTCNALFYDSGGPEGEYQISEDFTFTFYPETADKWIQVQFLNFNVEGEPYDYLRIFNGTDTNATLLAQYGDFEPGHEIIKASNSDGALTFHFSSDGSVQYDGWEAFISCFTPPQHDLAVVNITPDFINSGSTIQPQVTIQNNAVNDENSYQLSYTNLNGTYTGSQFYTDLVPSGGQTIVSLPEWTPADGNDTLTVTVIVTDDEDNTNDELSNGVLITPLVNAYAWDAYASTSGLAEGPVNITLPVGNMTQIAESSETFVAGADMVNFDWYGIQYSDSGDAPLVRIDTTTGELSTIGTTAPDITGFAFDVTTYTAYAIDFGGILYTIDLLTAQATQIGGNTSNIIGLACNNAGKLYAISLNDQLVQINAATGTSTVIGPLGVDISYAQDIAFDRDNDVLYGTLYTTTGGLYTIDTLTGAATLLATIGDELAGFAIPYTPAGAWVNFTVTDGTNPIENASIEIGDKTIYTDNNGQVTSFFNPNTYTYIATAYGFSEVTNYFIVVDGVDQDVNITLTELLSYSVTFEVENTLSAPLENANIIIEYNDVEVANGMTNASGQFVSGGFYPYEYSYEVTLDGYDTYAGTFTVVDQNLTVPVTLIETMNAPYGLAIEQQNNEADVLFTWNPLGEEFFEGFESGTLPTGWLAIDNDGDNFNWINIVEQGYGFDPYEGSGAMTSASYDNTVGVLYPDNYLITPAIQIGANSLLSWYHDAQDPGWPNDFYYVKVSTTGTNIADFTETVWSGTTSSEWQSVSASLSAFAGETVYIAFQHTNCSDNFWMKIDNVSVTNAKYEAVSTPKIETVAHQTGLPFRTTGLSAQEIQDKLEFYNSIETRNNNKTIQSYSVLLNDVVVATEITDSSYVFDNLAPGTYEAGVFGVYETGNSDTSYIEFTVVIDNLDDFNTEVYSVYPNPVKNILNIKISNNETYKLQIISTNGSLLMEKDGICNESQIILNNLEKGVYIIKLSNDNEVYQSKLIVQ